MSIRFTNAAPGYWRAPRLASRHELPTTTRAPFVAVASPAHRWSASQKLPEFASCEAGNPAIWLRTEAVAIGFRSARLDETENHA